MLRILAAGSDDIDDLINIQYECGLSSWSREAYAQELARSDAALLVARTEDSTVAGFLAGRWAAGSGEAEIYNIGTRPSFRRQKVGSALLKRFIELCEECQIASVWLEVRTGNSAAQGFYRSHGFTDAGTRKSFYSHPVEDARLMVLRLETVDPPRPYRGA